MEVPTGTSQALEQHTDTRAGLSNSPAAGVHRCIVVLAATLDTEVQNLQSLGYVTHSAADASSARTMIDELAPDVVLVDAASHEGAHLLHGARRHAIDAVVVAVAPPGSSYAMTQALAAGAHLLPRPLPRDALPALLERALAARQRDCTLAFYQQRQFERFALRQLVGESPPMLRLKAQLHLLIDAERLSSSAKLGPLLLQGETGTGRGRVARALHVESQRRARAFVAVEADAWGPNPEERLLGTGHGREPGMIDAAEGGTLFLEELADTPRSVQALLVELLTTGHVLHAPGVRTLATGLHLVAATRWTPDELARDARVLPQLQSLLSSTVLRLPPLRERGDDLILLARRFVVEQARRQGIQAPTLDRSARRALASNDWPGNVRELRNTVERAVLLQTHGVINAAHVAPTTIDARHGAGASADLDLQGLEHDAMMRALERSGRNVSGAARLLGISRDAMRYRMSRHGLDTATTPPWPPSE